MKLHWSPRSPFVRKVMVCAHETGIVDRFECVRSPVAMDRPNLDLLPDNPLSKLPTLVLDDGLALFDSSVICEYLDTLHDGANLFPAKGRERFIALQQQAFADGLLDVLLLWRQERNKPQSQQRPEWLAAFKVKSTASLDALEKLAPQLRLNAVQIGDIAIACVLSYYDFRLPDLQWRDGHPALAAWHARFAERDSMRRTEPGDGE